MNTAWIKRFRLPLIGTTLVLLYLIAGFIVAPNVLREYLTETMAAKTGYTVTVGDIDTNPLLWRVCIHDFSLHNEKGKLLAFKGLKVNLDGFALFRREVGIEEITLDAPYVDITLNDKGELLLASVLARLSEPDNPEHETTPEPEDTSPMPALLLEELAITDGTVFISTPQLGKRLQQTLQVQSLTVTDLHTTKPAHANRLQADIGTPGKGTLDLDATIDLPGQATAGQLKLKGFNLQPVIAALDLPYHFHLAALPLDIDSGFSVSYANALQLTLEKTAINLHQIRLSHSADSPVLADIPLVKVQGVSLDLPKQAIAFKQVIVSDGKLQLSIDKAGQHNWQALLPAADAEPASAQPSGPGWQLAVGELQLSNHALQFHSEQTTTPLDLALMPINITINDFQPLAPARPFPVQMEIGLPEQGKLVASAQVQTSPLQLSGQLSLQALALPLLQPLVDDAVYVDIKSGTLGADVQFNVQTVAAAADDSVNAAETLAITANGSIVSNDFHTTKKGSKKKLLTWQTLAIPEFSYDLASNHLAIASIDATSLYGRFIINENGESNLQRLVVEQPPATASSNSSSNTTASSQPAQPLSWDIARINLINSELGFSDLSLRPSFKTSIKNLSGQVASISSRPEQKGSVKLKGKVDEYAPVTIAGTFNLSTEKPQLNMQMDFKNIELTSFTPYSGVYAGYVIDKGQLSMELEYALVKDRIRGKNHVVLNQLVLGDKVESTRAIDLPLKLAIALLSDENGVIDLGFDVKGDIREPKFSINKIIWKAVLELLKKTVTAPFTYIGSLFKGNQENLQELGFTAGSEEIAGDTLAKLETVAQALQKKPMLQLSVQGNALPAVDKPALQEKELLQILSTETRQAPERFLPRANPTADDELYGIVADYYHKQRAQKLSVLQNEIATEWKQQNKTVDKDELKKAVYAQAWETLVETTPVTADDIADLARRRAQQAKAMLVEKHGIDASRIFIMENKTGSIEPALTVRLAVDAR